MNRIFTMLVAALAAFTIGATTLAKPAEAGKRERRIAAGIIAGAIIGGVIADRSYRHGRYYRTGRHYRGGRYYRGGRHYRAGPRYYRGGRYYRPARRYVAPRYYAPRRTYRARALRGRHARCAARYRSYNPRTGMYLAYSGRYRRCR